jgi:hypothetical protein
LESTSLLFTSRSIPSSIMSWDGADTEAKKSGLKKFQGAIKKYIKLHNWRKESHYPMLRNAIRALYLVISRERHSRWLPRCEDFTCLRELANYYLLAYFAFLETIKISFRIRRAACVCMCLWFQLLNLLTDFHKLSYKVPF